MGLHFIKNGTKHDVCVKRPSLFPASATTYDNSQSGLSATRVQGAIDEVASELIPKSGSTRGVVYMTSTIYDGSKRISTMIPLPHANQKTITLTKVTIAGQGTDYSSDCSAVFKVSTGFAISTTNASLVGNACYVDFDYT